MVRNLYPFQSNYFDRAGVRLHYLDEGAGHPVVMVHGNPTWSFYYRNLVLALRDRYRCIVPDHIGCGLSDKPRLKHYDYSLRNRVDDFEALLEHLEIRDCTLVVHDWGGMIGMAYAVRHPERINRLVVLNTAAFPLPHGKKLPLALWLGRNTWLGTLLIRGLNQFCRSAARIGVKRKALEPEVRAAYLHPYDSWHNRVAVSRFVQTIPIAATDEGFEIVAEVDRNLHLLRSKPMLIAWGLQDFVFDHHFLAEWQKRFPDAEVLQFADAGHYILEDAGDEIIPQIRDFLGTLPQEKITT